LQPSALLLHWFDGIKESKNPMGASFPKSGGTQGRPGRALFPAPQAAVMLLRYELAEAP